MGSDAPLDDPFARNLGPPAPPPHTIPRSGRAVTDYPSPASLWRPPPGTSSASRRKGRPPHPPPHPGPFLASPHRPPHQMSSQRRGPQAVTRDVESPGSFRPRRPKSSRGPTAAAVAPFVLTTPGFHGARPQGSHSLARPGPLPVAPRPLQLPPLDVGTPSTV